MLLGDLRQHAFMQVCVDRDRSEKQPLTFGEFQIFRDTVQLACGACELSALQQEGTCVVIAQKIEEGREGRFAEGKTLVGTDDERGTSPVVQCQALALTGQQHHPKAAIEPESVDGRLAFGATGGDPRDVGAGRGAAETVE